MVLPVQHPSTPTKRPIWRVPFPCGGIVRAERGAVKRWVLVCNHCGGGMLLLDRLSRHYGVSITQILDGPGCEEVPWRLSRSRPSGPAEPMLAPKEFRDSKSRLFARRQLLNYLRTERGLMDKTIRRANLGYGQPNSHRPPGIIIPIPPEDPVTYRIRYWPDPWLPPGSEKTGRTWSAADGCWHEDREPSPVKIATPRGHRQSVYPRVPLKRWPFVVLTEGEFDCLIVRQHGLHAVAVPGCNAKVSILRKIGRRAHGIAVCFDQDEREAMGRAVYILGSEGAEAWAVDVQLPERGDDLTDHFVTYGRTAEDLRRLIRKARKAPR